MSNQANDIDPEGPQPQDRDPEPAGWHDAPPPHVLMLAKVRQSQKGMAHWHPGYLVAAEARTEVFRFLVQLETYFADLCDCGSEKAQGWSQCIDCLNWDAADPESDPFGEEETP